MIGQTLSHFKITAKLGEGGMGEVYLAEDSHLKRQVALKVLPLDVAANPERYKRFRREAEALAALNHPNIVTIHSIEQAGDIHFLTMERVEGRSLDALEQDGPTALSRFLEIAIPLVEALAAAHSKGIVHRDLKPANIMVTDEDQRIKVLDFGLAKLTPTGLDGAATLAMSTEMTQEGTILGTVPYMSPEQVLGKPADHRSDLFALGIIMYELLAGRRPFGGAVPAELVSSILKDEPRSLTELRGDLTPRLLGAVGRCLEKDPAKRPQSAAEVLDTLRSVRRDLLKRSLEGTIEAPVVPPTEPGARRNRLAIGAVAVALALAGWLFWARPWQSSVGRQDVGPIQASFEPIVQEASPVFSPALSPDGRSLVYISGASGQNDVYLSRVGGRNPLNLTEDQDLAPRSPSFSPDGDRIVFDTGRGDGGLFIMGATGESVRRLTDFGHDASWSPDGRQLAFASEAASNPRYRTETSALWVANVASGEAHKISEADAMQPTWSPDGDRLAVWGVRDLPDGRGQRDIATLGAENGEVVWVTDDLAVDWNPVWSPGGEALFFLSDRGGSMNIWKIGIDPKTGGAKGQPRPLTAPSSIVWRLGVSGDGTRMVYTDADFTSNLFKVQFDQITMTIEGSPEAITRGRNNFIHPNVSPDGEWIVFQRATPQEDIFLVRSDGRGLRQLTDDAHNDRVPSWSPDGKRIVFNSDRAGPYELWEVGFDGSGLKPLTEVPTGAFGYPSWSPDGRKMATSGAQGTVLWDVTGPGQITYMKTLPRVNRSGRVMGRVGWSSDGHRLAGVLTDPGSPIGVGLATYSLESGSYATVHSCEPGTQIEGPVRWLNEDRHLITMILRIGANTRAGRRRDLVVIDIQSGDVRRVENFPSGATLHSLSAGERTLFFDRSDLESDIWMATLE